MIKVGVTGGIGSGKTTVCRIFESFGVPVYYADDRAKLLIVENEQLRSGYQRLFGVDVYTRNGQLNRGLVAEKIFNDQKLLQQVNDLVHPVVHHDFQEWCNKQSASYVIEEAAVLIESGGYRFMDKVILVTAPEKRRINRVMERDGNSRAKVEERINNQWNEEQLRRYCDFEVKADDVHLVTPQILNIHNELIK
ncbi:dephospho-CoA kinase [Marinilabilia salmonicolor]|uniref:dephospho-CoA kinase n=1 Tax=Marinilabilia salmonicolor TaxID=989 RepID=UPI00029A2C22|nr:dephospho-CoA kinase [Marinilabilia salmonicolor]